MNFGGKNTISKTQLYEIKNVETALIISRECNETMVVVNNPKKAFGVESHIIEDTNLGKITLMCKKIGFPQNMIYIPTSSTGEVYITMECSNSLPIAVCVKELQEGNEKHLKLCKVLVRDNAAKRELTK